jgi:stearoyl-CoA desaturase (delta-9 desaturase)
MEAVHNRVGCAVLYFIIYSTLLFSIFIFINQPSWLIVASVVLLKIYQTIGGGFAHLQVTHLMGRRRVLLDKVGGLFWLLCGQGSLSHFAYYHTLHHRYADTEADPHSPKYGLKWWCWWLSAYKYNQYMSSIKQHTDKVDNRISQDLFVHYTDKCYWECLAIIGIICFYLPTWFSVYFVMLPFALNFLDGTYFFVRYFHREDKAKNYKWVNYWIAGKSGFHGAHHNRYRGYREQ